MKVEALTVEVAMPEFKPAKFIVTIETLKEAQELYHRLAINLCDVKQGMGGDYEYDYTTDSRDGRKGTFQLFKQISDLLDARGIKP